MAEVACDQVGHEDKVSGLTVASGAGLGRLDQPIYGLDRAIAQRAVETVQDAVPVRFEGQGQPLEGSQFAASRPSEPGGELFVSFLARGRGHEDVAQGFLQPERASGLEMHARQLMMLVDLSLGPAVLVLEPHPSAVLERRFFANLGAPHLFKRSVGQLDDVEPVEGNGRVRQMPPDTGNIGSAHVDAGGRDGVRIAAMGAEVFGEGFDGVRVAALTGKEQPAYIKVMEHGDVIVSAPRGRLVDPHCCHVAEVLQRVRCGDVVIEHAPYPVVSNLKQISDGLHRHLAGERDHEGVEQLAEPTAAARPGNRDLPGLAACATGNAWNRGVDESLVLEEAQMFPRPGPRVMDRLISRAAGRAGKPAAGLEADLEVDLLCLGIEAHVRDAPRHLQAKRHREQTRLGPHGASPSPNLWERYSTLEHRRRKQIRRVWRCDVFGLRARRASPRDHNIWGCPEQHPRHIAKGPHGCGNINPGESRLKFDCD